VNTPSAPIITWKNPASLALAGRWFHGAMPFGKVTLLRSKLSFVGRNGYVPFSSMIVEWNPQTVKRRPGEVDIVLDAGQCIGGGSGRLLWANMSRADHTTGRR
jgi:hypothetical protein